jgi:hypothetical protein
MRKIKNNPTSTKNTKNTGTKNKTPERKRCCENKPAPVRSAAAKTI